MFLIVNPNNPPKLESDVKEIEHDNQNKAGQEHRYGTKDPQEQRERKVEGSETQRPEVAASVHSVCHILCCQIVMLQMRRHLLERRVDQNACMTVVPYGLHIEQESHQETDQNGKVFDGVSLLACVPVNENRCTSIFVYTTHQHSNERAEHDRRGGQKG